jgi:hypothetical protein
MITSSIIPGPFPTIFHIPLILAVLSLPFQPLYSVRIFVRKGYVLVFIRLITTGGADNAVFQWRLFPNGGQPAGDIPSDDEDVRLSTRSIYTTF